MNTCFCGNPADANGIRCSRCMALRILDLEADATEKQIKASYRTMVKVWHPDRFQNDKLLKQAAEVKLRDINVAFDLLSSTTPNSRFQTPQNPVSSDATGHAPRPDQNEPPSQPAATTSFTESTRGFSRSLFPAFKILLKLAALVFLILLCRYTWIAFDVPDPSTEAVAKVYSFGKDNILSRLENPKRRFIEAVDKDLERIGLRNPPPAPDESQQAQETTPQSPLKTPGKATTRQQAGAAAPRKIYAYITIGSSRDEVVQQQGIPTAASPDRLVYGRSELYLKDGAVTGWKIDPVSNPIRVKLWPQAPVDTNQKYFTVDSTRDDVLVIQGTPTAFSKEKFTYGASEGYFQNNRVVSWKNDPASIPLRAGMP
jgi:curved DNA-binding protein CbpA